MKFSEGSWNHVFSFELFCFVLFLFSGDKLLKCLHYVLLSYFCAKKLVDLITSDSQHVYGFELALKLSRTSFS